MSFQGDDHSARPLRLFDVYMAVDWSARGSPSPAQPTRDALWVGERMAERTADADHRAESYWRTRHACLHHIRGRLLRHAQSGRRVLIGFDFCFGLPAGAAAAFGLGGTTPAWRALWDEVTRRIVDDAANGNNRFAVAADFNARCGGSPPGPFWGCPCGTRLPELRPTSPAYPYHVRSGLPLERLRCTDRRHSGVQPVWKLYGHGSVGGQTLLGIPAVARLRDDPQLAAISRVWPFETGFTAAPFPATGPFILHTEIWPGLVPEPLDPAIPIRDQAQVRAVVRWLSALDQGGALGRLFGPLAGVPPAAPSAHILGQEGWILGSL